MSSSAAISLTIIALVAVLAPIISELLWKFRLPSVLIEIILGIIIGPSLLHLAKLNPFTNGLSGLGLCFLFFLAGFEINFSRLKGPPIIRGTIGWGISLALGLSVGLVLMLSGFVISSLLIGLALTTTAIGTLMPILKDRGILSTPFGSLLTAAGAVGEFGPILAVTILLGTRGAGIETGLLILFVILAVLVALLASRPHPPRLIEAFQKHLNSSTQLPVRVMILLIAGMVAVASRFGLELLLGAFSAGLIARWAVKPDQSEQLLSKLEAVGFGFLIPIFFIVSGMKFNAPALWQDPATIWHALIFFGLLLLIRGVPALVVYRDLLSLKQRTALGFLQATALPMIVVIVQIGISTHTMKPMNGTALMTAGILSVLIFPLLGFGILNATESSAHQKMPYRHNSGPEREVIFDDELFPDSGA